MAKDRIDVGAFVSKLLAELSVGSKDYRSIAVGEYRLRRCQGGSSACRSMTSTT